MERLPETEQKFIVEFIKKISRNNKVSDNTEIINKKRNPQEAIRRFIDGINAITDEPLDDEFDEIIKSGIHFRELDL
jgi:hypothetical protein